MAASACPEPIPSLEFELHFRVGRGLGFRGLRIQPLEFVSCPLLRSQLASGHSTLETTS